MRENENEEMRRTKAGGENFSVIQWAQFLELGKDIEDSVIEDKIKAQKPEQCALLIYTVSTVATPLHSI